jgi:hypothetical protein
MENASMDIRKNTETLPVMLKMVILYTAAGMMAALYKFGSLKWVMNG